MEYLLGNKQIFIDFLNNITKKDKIAVLTHTDLDGIASCVLLEKILEKKNLKVERIEFLNIKPKMLENKTEELKEKNITKIFITDLTCENIDEKNFQKLKENIDTILIDHHPILSGIKDKKNIIKSHSCNCATKMVFELGKEFLDEKEWAWIICATMFAEFSYRDNENLNFIKKFYPDITEENMATSVPGMNARKISNALLYFDKDLKHVYQIILKKDMKELDHAFEIIEDEINQATEDFSRNKELFEKQKIYWYKFSPKFNIGSAISTIMSKMKPDYTILIATTEDAYTKISARNQSGNYDMNTLMKKGIKNLEHASGGGHVKASAARFKTEDLEKFKENILKE